MKRSVIFDSFRRPAPHIPNYWDVRLFSRLKGSKLPPMSEIALFKFGTAMHIPAGFASISAMKAMLGSSTRDKIARQLVERVDGARQADLVSDFPSELVRECVADEHSLAILEPLRLLIGGHDQVGVIHLEEFEVIDGEGRKEFVFVLGNFPPNQTLCTATFTCGTFRMSSTYRRGS